MFNFYISAFILWSVGEGLTSLLENSNNVTVQQQNLTIDLSSYDKLNKSSQAFLCYLNVSTKNTNVNIEVINAPSNGGFYVLQFHSFKADFTLRNEYNEFVSGRNTGLVQLNLQHDVKYCYILKSSQESPGPDIVKILVAVVVYEKEDPVPGGCNLTFRPGIAPYQMLTYSESMVKVDAQPASAFNSTCERNPTHLDMYHFYLREGVLDENDYYEGISKMITVDGIVNNANKMPQPNGLSAGRRFYSAYLGTGAVYGAMVKHENRSSAYIPTASYACNTTNWDEECKTPTTTAWKIICALMLFLGFFPLYFGNKHFKSQMIIIGFVFGFLIAYLIAEIADKFTTGQSVTLAFIAGIIYGVLWIALWWRVGSPVLSVLLGILFLAYMTCCIIFYSTIADKEFVRANLNYWCLFVSVLILITLLLATKAAFSHILSCSFLGATFITLAINHYTGSNLHYIIVNNVRRITVPDFNKAIIDPTFQYIDVLLSIMWLALLGSGVAVQLRFNRGRAPFPPRDNEGFFRSVFPRSLIRRFDERSPLIQSFH